MRLINKKTKANTTISNPQKGLHPFIRKVGVSFSFLWGILFQELARLRIIPASPDKIKEKIKSNQIKIIRTHRKMESMSVLMMLLCLSLYSCLFVYLRVFVYSCIYERTRVQWWPNLLPTWGTLHTQNVSKF